MLRPAALLGLLLLTAASVTAQTAPVPSVVVRPSRGPAPSIRADGRLPRLDLLAAGGLAGALVGGGIGWLSTRDRRPAGDDATIEEQLAALGPLTGMWVGSSVGAHLAGGPRGGEPSVWLGAVGSLAGGAAAGPLLTRTGNGGRRTRAR